MCLWDSRLKSSILNIFLWMWKFFFIIINLDYSMRVWGYGDCLCELTCYQDCLWGTLK